MKKPGYFIPLFLLAALDVAVLILGIDSIPLQHFLWLALFSAGGLFLSFGRSWGAFFGLIPAFEFVHMSTIHTGQVIHIELPLGIALAVYYILCGLLVYRKSSR